MSANEISRNCAAGSTFGCGVTVPACPACSSSRHAKVSHESSAFRKTAGGEAFLQPAFDVRECAECGLYFKSNVIGREDLIRLYQILDYKTFEREGLFPTDRIVVSRLRRLPRLSRILDFGCGVGRILSAVSDLMDCHGVEINPESSAIAEGRGVRIWSEAQVLSGQSGRFEAIVLTDVYEHLFEPISLVEKLVSCLQPGGLFLLSTGLGEGLEPKWELAKSWYFGIPEHLQVATVRHLKWVEKRLNLRIEGLWQTSHYGLSLKWRLQERVQLFLYRMFHEESPLLWRCLLAQVPIVRRAARWAGPPAVLSARDHVVVEFRQQESCSPPVGAGILEPVRAAESHGHR